MFKNIRTSGNKFQVILIALFLAFGMLTFLTFMYTSLYWLGLVWVILALLILGTALFACPNCYNWFTLKEIERIELASFKGFGNLNYGTLQYYDLISPKATEHDKIMLTHLATGEDEIFPRENRLKKGSGVIFGKIDRIMMQCVRCKYKFPRYNKSSKAFAEQTS